MARVLLMLALAGVLHAFQPPSPPPSPPPAEPEEEDVTAKERTYEFNPIQAENELKVGRFYMRRGRWKAAAGRFEEATKWNPQSAEAWRLLGEAREKLRDLAAARAAYEKFLELAGDSRDAADVRRRLSKLPAAPPKAPAP
ncbi:MAG: tetratricopeptide repeat protein [Bryobacteraceae bacterium]|nr:tetratricopeptide repeat protein [Bryobacteraceae bacterium]